MQRNGGWLINASPPLKHLEHIIKKAAAIAAAFFSFNRFQRFSHIDFLEFKIEHKVNDDCRQ